MFLSTHKLRFNFHVTKKIKNNKIYVVTREQKKFLEKKNLKILFGVVQ